MWTDARRENCFFIAVGVLAILFYTGVLLTQAVDMPKWDDYIDILQFLDRWIAATAPSEKWRVFVSHTNEHILLVTHAIVLAQYYLLGKVNFAALIVIGNLFYLGTTLVLYWHFKGTREAAFAFAVLCLLGLTFYPHESTLWAMTALSNQAVVFFSLLALCYSTRPTPSLPRTMLFTTLAIFSQSNGFFLLPIVGVALYRRQRNLLGPWSLYSIALLICYAMLFEPASHKGSDTTLLSALASLPLSHWLMTAPILVAAFGSFLFSTVGYMEFVLALTVGILILALASLRLRDQRDDFVCYALLFVVASIASVALYRGLLAGPSIVFTSRYKMYALYFLALALLLSPHWLERCNRSPGWRYTTLLLAGVIFSASFWLNLPAARLTNNHLRQSLEYWAEDGDLRRAKGYFIPDTDSYLFAALHRGTWTPEVLLPPERFLREISPLAQCPEAPTLVADSFLLLKHINRNAPAICVDKTRPGPELRALFLCGTQHHYRVEWPGNAAEGRYYLPAAAIEPDSYRILVQVGDETRETPAVLLRKPRTR